MLHGVNNCSRQYFSSFFRTIFLVNGAQLNYQIKSFPRAFSLIFLSYRL